MCRLVPRPSHHPEFDHLQYAKNGGGRPGPFYHVNDVSVYLGRQRGQGSLIKTTSLRSYLVVSTPSAGVLNVRKVKNKLLLVQNKEQVCKMCFLLFFLIAPSVYPHHS